jgi:hypothetical protein
LTFASCTLKPPSTREGTNVEASGKIPRRTFLHGTAAVAAVSALPLSVAPPAFADTALALGRRTLTRSTFAPLQGSTFRVTGDGHAFDVVLSEINDLLPSRGGDDEKRFSLVFSASPRPSTQGTRTFHNDRVGQVSMVVVPVGRGKKTLRLESIFNS